MKIIEKSLLSGLIVALLLQFAGFCGTCQSISEKIVRLHVLANSDSKEDQDLKLKVRDKILEYSGTNLLQADSKQTAIQTINSGLNEIENVARKEIHNQGYDYNVKVELTKMHFNTRRYNEISLPAGDYDALRVSIGSAQGKNWWCVIFPPMCLPAAEEKQVMDDVLTPVEMDLVESEDKYEIRFKIVEWFEAIKSWFTCY